MVLKLEQLQAALAPKDQPHWLQTLIPKLNEYQERALHQNVAGREILQTVISVAHQIENQRWDIENSAGIDTVEFATVYEEVYVHSGIPKLFETLIAQLEWIINSNQIDSLVAIKHLEKLLANLKKNSKGDIFSREYLGRFVKIFIPKLGWKYLESIPGLKQPLEAFRETAAELELGFAKVREEVMTRLATEAEPEQTSLPEIKFPALPAKMIEVNAVLQDDKPTDGK